MANKLTHDQKRAKAKKQKRKAEQLRKEKQNKRIDSVLDLLSPVLASDGNSYIDPIRLVNFLNSQHSPVALQEDIVSITQTVAYKEVVEQTTESLRILQFMHLNNYRTPPLVSRIYTTYKGEELPSVEAFPIVLAATRENMDLMEVAKSHLDRIQKEQLCAIYLVGIALGTTCLHVAFLATPAGNIAAFVPTLKGWMHIYNPDRAASFFEDLLFDGPIPYTMYESSPYAQEALTRLDPLVDEKTLTIDSKLHEIVSANASCNPLALASTDMVNEAYIMAKHGKRMRESMMASAAADASLTAEKETKQALREVDQLQTRNESLQRQIDHMKRQAAPAHSGSKTETVEIRTLEERMADIFL